VQEVDVAPLFPRSLLRHALSGLSYHRMGIYIDNETREKDVMQGKKAGPLIRLRNARHDARLCMQGRLFSPHAPCIITA
ncbi:MAG TPA: hypothetical protein PKI80_13495, partial [Deltaproteobacteria bacterium]|nr:hypothetical protein [Deltaproteobacteria bacterium]